MTQVEMVQLWKEVTGNENLNVTFNDGYVQCFDISMNDVSSLFKYYNYNDLYLIYRKHLNFSPEKRSVAMLIRNLEGFENNGKRWRLSK
jgi:hypothetical protein